MLKQRLLRALVIWVILVLIPIALILTGRVPAMGPTVVNVLSVITLVATLALGYYVLAGRGADKR
jgi:uncharacterized RDD family membrane protein YckC